MKEKRNISRSRRDKAKARSTRKSAPEALLSEPMRLNRYIAKAGVCARRKADELIKEGRVKVNGQVATEMGIKITAEDVVEVNGDRITPQSYDYILLNKPKDVITSNRDDKDRKIVLDLIADEDLKTKGLFPVGRLDRNTTGVLLMTNDGELAHRLMHPRYEIEKIYRVRTQRNLQTNELEKLLAGIDIDGSLYKVDKAAYIDLPKKNEIGVSLHEGKNRHIRKMIEAIGHTVVRLERVRYAGLTTRALRIGKWRRLTDIEVKKLRRLVKLR